MSTSSVKWILGLGMAGAIAAFPLTVLADKIDGAWCRGISTFSIQGARIVTPAGNTVWGKYTRHAFSYVVPGNEPGAGNEIRLLLLDEETVQLIRGVQAEAEIWRRCKTTSLWTNLP